MRRKPNSEDTPNRWKRPKGNTRKTPNEGENPNWARTSRRNRTMTPKTRKKPTGERTPRTPSREEPPYWVYKECKKIGVKKSIRKEENKKTIFIPHEDREAHRAEQEAYEEVIGDTP